ncbi:MAG TPA: sigma-70 family RNA polymerase sigma factor [Mesorhizobium sp.]|nr:sigma-70 family RNA polymerase sigma factor [Mesorhizobium sp.]
MSGKDDRELADLLRSALAGDERAYARFLEQVARLVRGFARKRAGSGGVDPEDVVQETLLSIHAKRHTWRTDAPVLPWVFGIARYRMIDAYRKRGRRVEIELDEIMETVAQPEEDAVSVRDIGRALEALTPGQRLVVSAISVEGHTIAETAAKHDMSQVAVRVALHRGLSAIAKKFGQG